jgi:hypothetical protein
MRVFDGALTSALRFAFYRSSNETEQRKVKSRLSSRGKQKLPQRPNVATAASAAGDSLTGDTR